MVWKAYDIKENILYKGKIGTLVLWVKTSANDWYLAYERDQENQDVFALRKEDNPPASLSWNRWVTNTKTASLTLQPVMPDRSLIVRPEVSIRIPPGIDGTFFINIPLWIKVSVNGQVPLDFCEIPIYLLSHSWFGDMDAGELCYSKKSLVRRNIDELDKMPCKALCEVEIHNHSKTELNFERFLLNTENLSIFSDGRLLYTNRVKVIFQGEDQLSQITIASFPSGMKKDMVLLTGPRKEIDNNFFKKSFQFIKTLTGF